MSDDLSRCLVYGAYGYTGDLIARRAAALGMKPILAGRSEAKVRRLAEELSMPHRVLGLDEPAALASGLSEVDVVIHAAGPFSRTSRPMVDACLATGTHYLDITGEIGVFEACAARDDEARRAGVMLMPGTGFDVVPSDCLANHLKRRLPSATHLVLAFMSRGGALSSHGTASTMVESLGRPNLVRRDGRLTEVRMGALRRTVDFGRGPRPTVAIPWGDVSTAYASTRIPNIEVYMALPRGAQLGAPLIGYLGGVIGSGPVKRFLQRRVDAGPAGPTDAERARSESLFYGEASDGATTVRTRQRTLEGYTLTAIASLEIAKRVLAGTVQVGYQTPATVYGPDFILELEGSERADL